MKKYVILTGLLLIGIFAAACGTSLNIKTNEAGDTVIEVGLPESVVNTILSESVTTGDTENDLLTKVTSVDMKPGLITVTGTRTLADGTEAPGSFDLSLSTDNGTLHAAVSNVQIQGYSFTDDQLARLNQRIADSLSNSASDKKDAQITSVNITDTSLQFVVTIKKQ